MHLLTGHDYPLHRQGPTPDDAWLRAAWLELRDDLLAAHVRKSPGSRPWAWWRWSAPELRCRRLDSDVHPFDNPERLERVAREKLAGNVWFVQAAAELPFGVPRLLIVLDDFAAQYESEADFLERHGLLSQTEKREAMVRELQQISH